MVLATIEFSQLHCDKVVDLFVLLFVRVPQLQVVIKTVFIPQLQIVVKIDAIRENFALACFVMPVLVPTPVEIPQVHMCNSCHASSCTLSCREPWVQFSGKVVVPVVVQRQLRGSMVLNLWRSRSCSSSKVVDIPVVTQSD